MFSSIRSSSEIELESLAFLVDIHHECRVEGAQTVAGQEEFRDLRLVFELPPDRLHDPVEISSVVEGVSWYVAR
jgi:hypothetical protein